MKEAVIVSTVRTAVGKAKKGGLRDTRPDDLAALVIKEAVRRAGKLDPAEVEDVILGCAFPEGEQGMNVARIASFAAGLPHGVAGMTINRFCSSGLQAIAQACERIMTGQSDVIIAGGTESMTLIPMGGNKISPNPKLVEEFPEAYIGMGQTAENVASRYKISREAQDEFAAKSHQKAAAAQGAGKFKEEIVPVETIIYDEKGRPQPFTFEAEDGIRGDTTAEGLSRLRPAFSPTGTVTAGNASQMSDGAAASVVMSADRAKALGIKPIAIFRAFQVAGCHPDEMGIGPAVAIPKLMKKLGMKLDQIDLWEVNEAFASQAFYSVQKVGLDPDKVNVNGGAIALGHPLGCTGAKLTTALLHELKRRGARKGVVSMCIGGGMGAAGFFEMC
jgi:acetyl-CoA acyltransferase